VTLLVSPFLSPKALGQNPKPIDYINMGLTSIINELRHKSPAGQSKLSQCTFIRDLAEIYRIMQLPGPIFTWPSNHLTIEQIRRQIPAWAAINNPLKPIKCPNSVGPFRFRSPIIRPRLLGPLSAAPWLSWHVCCNIATFFQAPPSEWRTTLFASSATRATGSDRAPSQLSWARMVPLPF